MAQEYAPYYDGMQRGQGFNTFTQATCVNDAVTVTQPNPKPAPLKKSYRSELIDDYETLVRSLNISAGAAIEGWGQSGNIDIEYLNRSEFEKSDLTYEVTVHVQHQLTNPNQTYGDRYIADFITGGAFFARVSITSFNKSRTEEIKQAAKVAFTMYGVTGEVTDEVNSAVSTIHKHAEVKIVIRESGGGATEILRSQKSVDGSADLLAVKQRADQFYDNAEKHQYLLSAVLGRYENISDFHNAFQPFDYTYASKRTWELFDEFIKYISMESLIKNVPPHKYVGGVTEKTKLQNQRIKAIQFIRERVLTIRDDPSQADTGSTHVPAIVFRDNVLAAIKRVKYVAQSISVKSEDNWTDTVFQTLLADGSKLFEFTAYDFADVEGSTVVPFGSATDGPERYVALIGQRAYENEGWKEDSCFWVFEEKVDKIFEALISVSRLSRKNYIRLAKISSPDRNELFHFRGGV